MPRLPGFDYSTPAAYFLTIATYHRAPFFGVITPENDSIVLNAAGRMVQSCWDDTPKKFQSVTLDARCVMPDHFHTLLLLNCSGADERCSRSRVVQWFKSTTTVEYMRGVRECGSPRVDGHLWQRSFYDRIVRDEREFDRIRWYIEANPGKLFERMFG